MSKVFDLVLGVFREPGLVADLRDRQLPDDLALVIRLAAGEDAALRGAASTTGESAETLLDASVFFLQQILFAPGADSYRVLGADADSPQERLRENYRWLMKWLHPDRNQDGWEAVYADRVNVAWQDLKTPDRRAEYDRQRPSASTLAPMTAAAGRRLAPAAHAPAGPMLSGSTVRRLPSLILGSLGVVAAATIAIMYWAQTQTERELSELRHDRDPASAIGARVDQPLPAIADEPASKVDVTAAIASSALIETPPDPRPDASSSAPPAVAVVDSPLDAIATTSHQAAWVEPAATMSTADAAAVAAPVPLAAAEASMPDRPTPAPATVDVADRMPAAEPRPAVVESTTVASAPAVAMGRPVAVDKPVVTPATQPVAPSVTVVAGSTTTASPARLPVAEISKPAVAPVAPAASVEPPTPAPPAAAASDAGSEVATATPPTGSMPAMAAPAATSERVPAPAQSDAEALVREFAAAYAAGDLVRFNRLLSNTSDDSAALGSMRSRFVSTEMRYLEIQQLRWQADAEHGRARARFRDTYVPRGGRKAVTESGEIEWIIRVDAGDARIAGVARNDVGT